MTAQPSKPPIGGQHQGCNDPTLLPLGAASVPAANINLRAPNDARSGTPQLVACYDGGGGFALDGLAGAIGLTRTQFAQGMAASPMDPSTAVSDSIDTTCRSSIIHRSTGETARYAYVPQKQAHHVDLTSDESASPIKKRTLADCDENVTSPIPAMPTQLIGSAQKRQKAATRSPSVRMLQAQTIQRQPVANIHLTRVKGHTHATARTGLLKVNRLKYPAQVDQEDGLGGNQANHVQLSGVSPKVEALGQDQAALKNKIAHFIAAQFSHDEMLEIQAMATQQKFALHNMQQLELQTQLAQLQTQLCAQGQAQSPSPNVRIPLPGANSSRSQISFESEPAATANELVMHQKQPQYDCQVPIMQMTAQMPPTPVSISAKRPLADVSSPQSCMGSPITQLSGQSTSLSDNSPSQEAHHRRVAARRQRGLQVQSSRLPQVQSTQSQISPVSEMKRLEYQIQMAEKNLEANAQNRERLEKTPKAKRGKTYKETLEHLEKQKAAQQGSLHEDQATLNSLREAHTEAQETQYFVSHNEMQNSVSENQFVQDIAAAEQLSSRESTVDQLQWNVSNDSLFVPETISNESAAAPAKASNKPTILRSTPYLYTTTPGVPTLPKVPSPAPGAVNETDVSNDFFAISDAVSTRPASTADTNSTGSSIAHVDLASSLGTAPLCESPFTKTLNELLLQANDPAPVPELVNPTGTMIYGLLPGLESLEPFLGIQPEVSATASVNASITGGSFNAESASAPVDSLPTISDDKSSLIFSSPPGFSGIGLDCSMTDDFGSQYTQAMEDRDWELFIEAGRTCDDWDTGVDDLFGPVNIAE